MKVKRQKMTNPGCGGHQNQDYIWCKYNMYQGKLVVLAVVCDGVGGCPGGMYASKRVTDYLVGGFWSHMDQYEREGLNGDELFEKLTAVLVYSNHQIYEKGVKERNKMGTTASVFFLFDKKYYMLNVGDSRIYWKCGGRMYRTKDQTLYEEKKRMNKVPEENDSHVLMQSVGSQKDLQPDFYTGVITEPTSFMLMTDGAYRPFDQKELYQYCCSGDLAHLRRKALKRKEQDNLSCIWLQIS